MEPAGIRPDRHQADDGFDVARPPLLMRPPEPEQQLGERRIEVDEPSCPGVREPVDPVLGDEPPPGDHRAELVPARIEIDGTERISDGCQERGRREATIAIRLLRLDVDPMPFSSRFTVWLLTPIRSARRAWVHPFARRASRKPAISI